MSIHISDDKLILSVVGLRFIEKKDTSYSGGQCQYSLRYAYKGLDKSFVYGCEQGDKKMRDEFYNKIRIALTGRK